MQKTKKLLLGVIGCCLLLLLTANNPTSKATVVWSDDFDPPGDWTLLEGSYSTDDKCLVVTGSEICTVEHASTIAYGSWCFDLYLNDSLMTTQDNVWIILMADEISVEGDEVEPINGYVIQYDPDTFDCHRWAFFEFINGEPHSYEPAPISPAHTGLLHVNITRDCSGLFRCYANETLQWDYTFSTHTTSTCFGLSTYPGQAVDNVVVSKPDPPCPDGGPQIPLGLVLIGVGATVAILVIVIGVLFYRRRTS